jgi:hypothetical protein
MYQLIFLNQKAKQLLLPVPPIELQSHWNEIVEQWRNVKTKQIYKYEETNTLFNALMQRAFKGEL